eukprot:1133519-Pelagomonas_calceolata.AAC.7
MARQLVSQPSKSSTTFARARFLFAGGLWISLADASLPVVWKAMLISARVPSAGSLDCNAAPPASHALACHHSLAAAWRCHAAQHQLHVAVHAATALQCAWRRHAAQAQLAAARQAAVRVQAAARGLLARKTYKQQKEAVVHLQSLWRGWQVRAALQRQHQAATSVARAWRGFQARRHWGWARKAASTIQASMRMWSAQRSFCARKQAAIQLQVTAITGGIASIEGVARTLGCMCARPLCKEPLVVLSESLDR